MREMAKVNTEKLIINPAMTPKGRALPRAVDEDRMIGKDGQNTR